MCRRDFCHLTKFKKVGEECIFFLQGQCNQPSCTFKHSLQPAKRTLIETVIEEEEQEEQSPGKKSEEPNRNISNDELRVQEFVNQEMTKEIAPHQLNELNEKEQEDEELNEDTNNNTDLNKEVDGRQK